MRKLRGFLGVFFLVGVFVFQSYALDVWTAKSWGWGVLPFLSTGTSAAVSWANWAEQSEEKLASSKIYIMFLESASGNEKGQGGGLPDASLVGTVGGSLAGCTTTAIPPYRIFDGSDDCITWDTTALSVLSNGTDKWAIIVKSQDLNPAESSDKATPFYFYDGAANGLGIVRANGYGAVNSIVTVQSGGSNYLAAKFNNPLPITGVVYTAIWSDGKDIRAGWTTTGSGAGGQPTKWSDFAADNRLTVTTVCSWPIGTFTDATYGLMRWAAHYTPGKINYIAFCSESVIDNNS